jgi:hypothetical protein
VHVWFQTFVKKFISRKTEIEKNGRPFCRNFTCFDEIEIMRILYEHFAEQGEESEFVRY